MNNRKACIFVDGENFRYSLNGLFQSADYDFEPEHYLPKADWHNFFYWVADKAHCILLRAYWYVPGKITYSPYLHLKDNAKLTTQILKSDSLQEAIYRKFSVRINRENAQVEVPKLASVLNAHHKIIEERFKGWKQVQDSIENKNDQIEFRREGSVIYDLVSRQFTGEKAVDTHLATDLLYLSDIYDVAIVVSGDADYTPPLQAIKNYGKIACAVSFLTKNGKKLPGGAWALENKVDRKIEIPFDEMLDLMAIKSRKVEKGAPARKAVPAET